MAKERELVGIKDTTDEEDNYLDPDTAQVYQQFYQLPPTKDSEEQLDDNPPMKDIR